ncbi:MAG: hypothetical protein ACU836_09790 [Gammaproteobacteria bacterium]
MKKVQQQKFCTRCGEEISKEELTFLSGSVCALCEQMQFEALEIWEEVHERASRSPATNGVEQLRVSSR